MTGTPSILNDLLVDCEAHGIRLGLAGDSGLTIDAPQAALTPDLLARLKTHKAELLTMLRPASDKIDIDLTKEPSGEPAADVSWRALFELSPTPAELGPDSWPADCIDPDEVTPCPNCGTLELWQTLAGNWRCQRCDAPTSAWRGAQKAEQLKRESEAAAKY